jgi:Amt family ammonium transporter
VSLAGSFHQFLNQLVGVAVTVALAALGTFVLLKVVGRLAGSLRVGEEEESLGLDLTQHGEKAYND